MFANLQQLSGQQLADEFYACGLGEVSILKEMPNLSYKKDTVLLKSREHYLSNALSGIFKIKEAPTLHWNVSSNIFYSSGQSGTLLGEGLYSSIKVENQLELGGIPLTLGGEAIMQQNKLNTRLSSIGIEFDQNMLLTKLKKKIEIDKSQEAFSSLGPMDQMAIKKQFHIEATRQVCLSQEYAIRKNALRVRVDSLQSEVNQDSLLLDSLQLLMKRIDKFEQQVDSLYNNGLSKVDSITESIKVWKQKIAAEQKNVENLFEDGALHRLAKANKGLDGVSKALLNISVFKIGSFRLQGSLFDVASIPLHGATMEIRRNGYYASIAAGKEGRTVVSNPDFATASTFYGEGRRVLRVKSGLGMPEKSHLHLVVSTINAPGSIDSTHPAFAKKNVLVSLESRYEISEHVFTDIIGSLSSSDFTGQYSTTALFSKLYEGVTKGGDNAAALVRLGWKGNNGRSEYSVGYQTVGQNYTSLGNPFLVKNKAMLRLEGKQRFLKGKGQIKGTVLKGNSPASETQGAGIIQHQFSGELSYRLTKKGSRVWASFAP